MFREKKFNPASQKLAQNKTFLFLILPLSRNERTLSFVASHKCSEVMFTGIYGAVHGPVL